MILWTPYESFGDLQYILGAFVIIFLIGARDDILLLGPTTKLFGQLLAVFILVFKADLRLTSFHGIFGLEILPYWISIAISVFAIIVIINAFNLIDGINGLSGSITLLVSLIFGTWFYLQDRLDLTIMAFALAGSLVAFLKFNFTPAKIFMGDTGALFCGLVCSILSIEFINMHLDISSPYAFSAVPAVAIGILILPLFDTLRVFIMRVLRGKSPLHPDRTHIHHLLIDCGLSHMQATGILVLVNVMIIIFAMKFQFIGTVNLILIIASIALLLTLFLYFYANQKKAFNS